MKRHRRLICLVTIFGLLMFVSALWFKQSAQCVVADVQVAEHHGLSFVSSTSPTYLAEVKPRVNHSGASGPAYLIGAKFSGPQKSPELFVSESQTHSHMPGSRWLLNRSLLI